MFEKNSGRLGYQAVIIAWNLFAKKKTGPEPGL
jgi:hypothetical protein